MDARWLQYTFYAYRNTIKEKQDMTLGINKLLELRAISECEPQDQFLSNIFLTPKPNGGCRFILNLKQLNKDIYYS